LNLRATGAKLAHRVAVASRLAAWVRRGRDEALVLAYHNVVPDGVAAGERALHVPLTQFRAQLERVMRVFQVVPLAELLDRHRSGRSLEGLAAVTFDDGYRGVLRHALPILTALGCPATVFVVSKALGRDRPFWWDRFAAAGGGEIPGRERWLTEFEGDEAKILAGEPTTATGAWGVDYLPAGVEELAAVDPTLISLGVHTETHPNLVRVGGQRCERELRECWHTLRGHFSNVIPVVAYPYGAVDESVAAVAAGNGLAGVALGDSGLTHRDSAMLVPRVFVGPETTPDALELTVGGLRLKRKR